MELAVVMIASGYAMTFIGVDVLVFRLVHLVFDIFFTSVFLAHTFVSIIIIRVNWGKVISSLIKQPEKPAISLKLLQRVSGFTVLVMGALQVLSGLDRFHLGLGSVLPFTIHRVFDLYLLLSLILHGAVSARLAYLSRRAGQELEKTEKISVERRDSIKVLVGAVIAIASALFLNNPPKVGRGQETPKGFLPPGQTEVDSLRAVTRWPIPVIDTEEWVFVVEGLVEAPYSATFEEFLRLHSDTRVTDFHCVTGWTKFDSVWGGVTYDIIHEMVKPKPEARYVTFETVEGYTTSLPISDLRKLDALFAYKLDDAPLPREHGGPLRLVVPQKYGYKSAKWVVKLRYTSTQELGYWESRGYSNTADPYSNDRYS